MTGLSIIDIGTDLTTFGQAVLALMILAGGLGLMAITTFLQGFVVSRNGCRRCSTASRPTTTQDSDSGATRLRALPHRGCEALDEFGVGGVGRTFRGIALTATLVILVGAVILYHFGFDDIPNQGERLWAAVFHSISAYNNAGFGLWSDSLERYRSPGL